ncbi:DUF1493 family protein [Candidatus Pantoea persica]|nr:DUF1493 family protein [Candidatus Pantoea persica]
MSYVLKSENGVELSQNRITLKMLAKSAKAGYWLYD